MAHAVAAPDIFSTLAAFSQTKGQNETQLGVQGIFGKMVDSFITKFWSFAAMKIIKEVEIKAKALNVSQLMNTDGLTRFDCGDLLVLALISNLSSLIKVNASPVP